MGLDMYAYAVALDDAIGDSEIREGAERNNFEYWRKHHDLHGWMQDLYYERGGDESFNCIPVRLYLEDLDALEEAIKNRQLPHTTGFFFGNNPPDAETDAYDLDFVKKARELIAQGYAVYYDSWW